MHKRIHTGILAILALALVLALPACAHVEEASSEGSDASETTPVVNDRDADEAQRSSKKVDVALTFLNATGKEIVSVELKPSDQADFDENGKRADLSVADGATVELTYSLADDDVTTYDLRFTLADGSVLMVYQTQLSGQTTITVAASADSADASVSYEDASTGETVSTNGRTFSADESDEITYDLVTQAG